MWSYLSCTYMYIALKYESRENEFMRQIQLIAIDIDGTLLDSSNQLPDANAKAIREAGRDGVHLVLASSRPPRAITPLFERIGLDGGLVISCQGAITLRAVGGVSSLITERTASPAAVQRVLDIAAGFDADVNVYSGDSWLTSRLTTRVEAEAAMVGFWPDVVDLPAVHHQAHKLLVLTDVGDEQTVADALRHPEVEVAVSKPGYVEITRSGVDKGQALAALLRRLGLDARCAMSIGDGDNDVSMLRVTGVSVAMGNASPSARAAASHSAATNDDSGVAQAIREHLFHE